MRLKIALLCAMLVPLGTAKADVVTLTNSAASSGTTSSASLFIRFVTLGTGAFQLNTLTLNKASSSNAGIAYSLQNSAGGTINSISGTGLTATNGLLTFNNANLFGAGSYWLEITGLDNGYTQGASAILISSNSALIHTMDPGLVTGRNETYATGTSLFQANLSVNVPEPATMILTGSALAAGAIGAYFKRRRKPQTEIVA